MESEHRLTAEEEREQIKKWGHINDFLKKILTNRRTLSIQK